MYTGPGVPDCLHETNTHCLNLCSLPHGQCAQRIADRGRRYCRRL